MNYLKNHKRKVILYLLVLDIIFFGLKLFLFQLDGTSIVGKKLFIGIIAFISGLIIIVEILPVEMKIDDFIKKYRDVILFALYMYIMEITFLLENQFEIAMVTIFSIAFITIIFIILFLIVPKKLKLTLMIFHTLTYTIYLIFQDIYYVIFSDFASVKESSSAQAGIEFSTGVIQFEWIYLGYLIIGIIFIFLFIKYQSDNHLKITKKSAKIFFIPLLIFIVLNFLAEYPVNTARLHISDHYLYKSVYNKKRFVSRFAPANFLVRDLVDGAIPNIPNKRDIKDIDEYFSKNQKTHNENDYSGIFENKNVIFIMAESFDDIAINETLTPNIVKMQNEGINFDNHYVPVYPRTTCDSEIIYNTSIIPSITDGPTCYTFFDNSYSHSLANLFNAKEYQTVGFHSNDKEFYARYKVYDGFGYDDFLGKDEIGLNKKNKHFDTVFFEKAKDEIIKTDELFFSYITTLSGHSPYNLDNPVVQKHYDKVDRYYGDDVSKDIKAYIATQIELDLFVGAVFDDLEAKGLIEETVVILTTDHFPYTLPPDSYSEYKGIDELYLKSKAPLTIWADDITPHKVDKVSSSFDVLPTLANLFALDTDYTYYFGNDICDSTSQPLIYYKDYTWFDGDNYVSDGYIKNDGTGDKKYIEDTTVRVNKYFEISKKILRTNYFNKKK